MANREIDINSLKPNSHTYKDGIRRDTVEKETDEREKLTPVVKKDAVVSTKRPLGKKLADMFISEDIEDVKSYVIRDLIIPGIKNAIIDIAEMIFFGERTGRRGSRSGKDRDRVSYASYYKSDDRRGSARRGGRNDREYERNDRVDYRNIILRDRRDAEDVVDSLKRRIHEYGSATIADLLDLIEVTGKYTDNNWGWTDERDVGIRRVNSGYLIDVAEASYLED